MSTSIFRKRRLCTTLILTTVIGWKQSGQCNCTDRNEGLTMTIFNKGHKQMYEDTIT